MIFTPSVYKSLQSLKKSQLFVPLKFHSAYFLMTKPLWIAKFGSKMYTLCKKILGIV